MVSLSLVPLAIIVIQAILWRRDYLRRQTPEWREQRLRAFLNTELPSPCSAYGHQLGDHGCIWCSDLTPMWAYQSDSRCYTYVDPERTVCTLRAGDPRLVGFVQLGWRWRWGRIQRGPAGIAWVDRSRSKPDQYRDELPATDLATQRKPQYTPLHGNQATQAPPQGGSFRTERGAPGRPAQDRIRRAYDPTYSRRSATPGHC